MKLLALIRIGHFEYFIAGHRRSFDAAGERVALLKGQLGNHSLRRPTFLEGIVEQGHLGRVGLGGGSSGAGPGFEVGRGQFEDLEAQIFGGIAGGQVEFTFVFGFHPGDNAADAFFTDVGDGRIVGIAGRFWQLDHDEAPVAIVGSVEFEYSLGSCCRSREEVYNNVICIILC